MSNVGKAAFDAITKMQKGGFFVESFNAKGDYITDDGPFIQAAINRASQNGGGVVFLMPQHKINTTVTIPSNVVVKSLMTTKIKSTYAGTLFNIPANADSVSMEGVLFDYESSNSNLAILINENVTNLKINNIHFKNFKNLDPAVQQNVIRLKTGITGKVSNLSFTNIKTVGNGVITDGGGAGRCIRTDSSNVTALKDYALNIDNIKIEDCYNIDANGNMIIEDFDPIHFQHFSDVGGYINLSNVTAKNFSKRLIKIQGDGVNISNIVAQSDTYVPWLIASMGKKCNISNIVAKGNIKTVIEFLDSSFVNVNNVEIESTYAGSNVIDNLFNFYNSSNININQVSGNGYGGFLFYGNVTENISISKVNLTLSAQILFMQDRNSANTAYTGGKISNIKLNELTIKVPSTTYNATLFAIDGTGSVNPISQIIIRDLTLVANQLYQYGLLRIKNATDVFLENPSIENISTLTNPTLLSIQGNSTVQMRRLSIKGTVTTNEILMSDTSNMLLTRSSITKAQLSGTGTKLELEKTPNVTLAYSASATSAQVTTT